MTIPKTAKECLGCIAPVEELLGEIDGRSQYFNVYDADSMLDMWQSGYAAAKERYEAEIARINKKLEAAEEVIWNFNTSTR